jgi:hypothetical protein
MTNRPGPDAAPMLTRGTSDDRMHCEGVNVSVDETHETRPAIALPPAPDARRCGARRRNGQPCQKWGMANGRCRLHGGLSTGPRTAEGIARVREGARRWHARRRAEKEAAVEPGGGR